VALVDMSWRSDGMDSPNVHPLLTWGAWNLVTDDGRDRLDHRTGTEWLSAHLAATYDIRVPRLAQLDSGVFRIDRSDGPSWVARVFPSTRPIDQVAGDATILRSLEQAGFPAERCAHPEAVSSQDGRSVLVTEFVHGAKPDGRGRTFAVLGALLGRLHTRSGETARPGGAWHHLTDGTPRDEIAAALALLTEARERVPAADLSLYDMVRDHVRRADDGADLPHAFVHPDFVPANAVATPEGGLVLLDWAGAGRGPRIWSLGFLLFAAGARDLRLVDAVITRYRKHVELTPAELGRLADVIRARPLVIDSWSLAMGRKSPAAVVDDLAADDELADTIAERVRRTVEQ
jgi:Ser/Thr protein kinase RdoA (MazF antagonist)